MESFSRRYGLAGPAPAQKPAEALTPQPGSVVPSAAVNFSTEAGQASVAGKKFEQAATPSESTATAEHMVPLEIQLPAPAFKGTPREVPVLGDVPALGRFYRLKSELGTDAAATPGTSTTPAPAREQEKLSWGFAQTSAWADYNNDSHLDLFVNNGDGSFTPAKRSLSMRAEGVDLDSAGNKQTPSQRGTSANGAKRIKQFGVQQDLVASGALQAKVEEKVKSVEWTEEARSQAPALADKAKASPLIQDGKQLYEMGRLNEAEAKLKQSLQQDPQNETARYYLNLASEAKSKVREVTMRPDSRAVEQAWGSPAETGIAARPEALRPPARHDSIQRDRPAIDGRPALRRRSWSTGRATRGANADSLRVAGYANTPMVTNASSDLSRDSSTVEKYSKFGLLSELGTDVSGASRVTKSPIVLPSAQPETSLALKNSIGAEQKSQPDYDSGWPVPPHNDGHPAQARSPAD